MVDMVAARRAATAAVVSALLGAGATVLVMAHPFTDEVSGGLRLAGGSGSEHPAPSRDAAVPPGWRHGDKDGWKGEAVPPGWSHGDKDGWKGEAVPPGWSRHTAPGQQNRPDDGQRPDHGNLNGHDRDKQHGRDKQHHR